MAVVALVALNGCDCVQSDYKEIPSPDGQYIVIERETNCGATDPFGTAITLESRRSRLGMDFLGHPSQRVFLANVSLRNTSVTWVGNRDLLIACKGCEKYGVAEEVSAWMDIKIRFDVGKAGKGVF